MAKIKVCRVENCIMRRKGSEIVSSRDMDETFGEEHLVVGCGKVCGNLCEACVLIPDDAPEPIPTGDVQWVSRDLSADEVDSTAFGRE